MSVISVTSRLATDPAVREALRLATGGSGGARSAAISVAAGARPALIAAVVGAGAPTPLLVVTATGREAEDLAAALRWHLPPESVAEFPSWETLPHERLSPRADTVGKRLAVLRRLAHPDPAAPGRGPLQVVVASVRAALQPVVTGLGELSPVTVRAGDTVGLDTLAQALVTAGYTRTDLVERRGEFAVRGGIVDLFSATQEHPARIEFWGEEVEEVRWFAVSDQRSLGVAEHGVWAPPCREVRLTAAVRERAAALADRLPGVADLLGKVAEGIPVEGMESLAPILADGMAPLVDQLPEQGAVVVLDPERVASRAHDLVATSEEFLQASWSNAAAGNTVPVDLRAVWGSASYWSLARLREHVALVGRPWWDLTTFAVDAETDDGGGADGADGAAVQIPSHAVGPYRGRTETAVADLRRWAVDEQLVTVVVTEGSGFGQRLAEVLADAGVPCQVGPDGSLEPGVVRLATGSVGEGFLVPGAGLVVVTEQDLLGGAASSTRDMRRMPSRRRRQVDPLSLRPGDHVVHEQHGVGKFVEMTRRTIGAATREYLVLEYAASRRGQPGDRLYVPTDQLDQVTRYVGGESPALHKLGGSDWAATKSRARRHVRQIAGELIRLYSARLATVGHAFGPDTPWQRELEDSFAYTETPDQLSSIDEVKADMEKQVPMDRLICGDVGYGKTEIAVRAAFKAVQDGKQAAILAPTTLLVQQHHNTFTERYAPYPVRVEALSRFQSDKEAKQVLSGLADGSVDVVIGTHRLLGAGVRFKDLGLVVIDEEQRFGVEHKEQLKALRTAVDVLAMSATPIPRTLEMAVTGIREMSTLTTPPEERHPVLTFVGPYQERQITAAIRRELLRDGQVFYIHNTVRSMEKVAARLRELVPEARIATAHGQMGEARLEGVVVDFWERRVDVLVCTTIVETGLDIANANTLIVERADLLGLAQLHQLRGRVGRARERAYAYFLFPPDRPLTQTAHDRLATIAANTDLGAGMAVAMKDLEIRGAGNLLGGEQSGHIEGVGFDLYVRMVGEAVTAFRDGDSAPPPPTEIKIELPVNAHLPHEYVPGERLRLEAYRKLAAVADETELADIEAELNDRYGALPEPVAVLMEVARLRVSARRSGVADIALQGGFVRFSPVSLRESQQLRLERLYRGAVVKPAARSILVPLPRPTLGSAPLRDRAVLTWVSEVMRAILGNEVGAGAVARAAQG